MKAASQHPPLSMRWAILLLLEGWIAEDLPAASASPAKRARALGPVF